MLICENREMFEKFIIRLVTRGRKFYLGRGPLNMAVLIRKNYLIIEKHDFMAFAPESFAPNELWDCAEHIEVTYEKQVYPRFIRFLETITDLQVVASCATMIKPTSTRANILIADKPWEEAKLQVDLDSLDIDQVAELVFLGKQTDYAQRR